MARARPPWSSETTHLAPETPLPRRRRRNAFHDDDSVSTTPNPTKRRDPSPPHAIAAATPPRRRAPGAATSPSRSAAVRETREGTGDANPGASAAFSILLVGSPRTQASRTTPTMARSTRE